MKKEELDILIKYLNKTLEGLYGDANKRAIESLRQISLENSFHFIKEDELPKPDEINEKNRNEVHRILVDKVNIIVEKMKEILSEEEKVYFFKNLKQIGIANIQNLNKQMKEIKELPDEWSRALVIQLCRDENRKIELLPCLTMIGPIASVIKNIKDKDKKTEALIKAYEIFNNGKDNKKAVDISSRKYKELGIPKDMMVGIEIEAEDKNNIFTRLVKEIGFLQDYEVKDEMYDDIGVEIVSPKISDNDKRVEQIYEILKIMQTCGFEATANCGAHVHIGADYLQTLEEYQELLEIFGNSEKILYLISNQEGELPRDDVNIYAPSFSRDIQNNDWNQKEKDEFIIDAQRIQRQNGEEDKKNHSINLSNINVNNNKNTIEFRLSNGTLNPNIWIENIRLYGRIMQISHEIGKIKSKLKNGEKITEYQFERLKIKAKLKKAITDDEKMETLMELLFNEEERAVYDKRYQVNSELAKREKWFENAGLSFGTVDISDDMLEIAENDRIL